MIFIKSFFFKENFAEVLVKLLREVLTNIGETVRLLMTTDGGVMLHELI
jgi:hypothetical protein